MKPEPSNLAPNSEPPTPSALASGRGSELAAYQEGWKCGRSPTGEADENPYKHRLSKKRKAWLQGWMDGGAIYIECQRCMATPCQCAFGDAVIKTQNEKAHA